MNPVILIWKSSLQTILNRYETYRGRIRYFFPRLFLFFIFINIACYWLAIATAFPEHLTGKYRFHFFKIQFPVGLLGALFDSLSFFITVFIVRKALRATSTIRYISHLSIDVVIAAAATAWVLFVFSISDWLISFIAPAPQDFSVRTKSYEALVGSAVVDPGDNLKNIYFGIVMGLSTIIPTSIHLYMASTAICRFLRRKS